jgi:VWFA-related protein
MNIARSTLTRVAMTALLIATFAGGPGPAAAEPSSPAGALQAASAGDSLSGTTVPTEEQILRSRFVEVEKVRFILVPVRVEDRRGRTVPGLQREDFKLREDYIPQSISYFAADSDTPISIAFMLDVSGSMALAGKLQAAQEAIRYFVESLRPQDRFALICFADEQVAWVTEFTSDRERFLRRLEVQTGYGKTALHDAVAAAPALVEASQEGKKAIVLITDGVDNASRITLEQAVETARRASVPIYTIGFSSLPQGLIPTQQEVKTNFEVLRLFSEQTGGSLFAVHDPDELKEAAARIDEELRTQYLIGYQPTRKYFDGRYRRIQLETRRERFIVRARDGYYAKP